MKKQITKLVILGFTAHLSTVALAETKVAKEEVQVKHSTQVEGLFADGGVNFSDIEGRIKEALAGLGAVEIPAPEVDANDGADYAEARKAFQEAVNQSIEGYVVKMGEINTLIASAMPRIQKKVAEIKMLEENGEDKKTIKALKESVLNDFAALKVGINSLYQKGIDSLIKNPAFVFNAKTKDKYGSILDVNSTLFKHCKTRMCVSKLGKDLKEWGKYIAQFNMGVELEKKNGQLNAKTIWTTNGEKIPHHLSQGMRDVAQKMLDNPTFRQNRNNLAVLAPLQVLAKGAESTGGIALGVLSYPTSALESVAGYVNKYMVDVLTSKFAPIDLNLDKVELPTLSKRESAFDEYKRDVFVNMQ